MKYLLIISFFLCLPVGRSEAAEPPAKPNIIFILADDLGINDLRCYGRQDHHTPHLDLFAVQGMRFTSP